MLRIFKKLFGNSEEINYWYGDLIGTSGKSQVRGRLIGWVIEDDDHKQWVVDNVRRVGDPIVRRSGITPK